MLQTVSIQTRWLKPQGEKKEPGTEDNNQVINNL